MFVNDQIEINKHDIPVGMCVSNTLKKKHNFFLLRMNNYSNLCVAAIYFFLKEIISYI